MALGVPILKHFRVFIVTIDIETIGYTVWNEE